MSKDLLVPGFDGLDDYDWTITGAAFEETVEYDGIVRLVLTGTSDDTRFTKSAGEVVRKVNIGKLADWEVVDDGERVERADGTDKMFHPRSAYQSFINAAVKAGARDVLVDRGGDPRIANIWLGLQFHIGHESYDFNKETQYRVVPDAYLGEVEVDGVVKSASNGTSNGTTATTDSLRETVRDMARQYKADGKTFNDFANEALNLAGVAEDEGLFAEIADKNGIYASV